MIACLNIQAFSLRAALRSRPELMRGPIALAPPPGSRPLLGACSALAEEAGVRPGMRLSEALANCPELVLAEQDPAAAEEEWERILRRLEEAGLAVEPIEPGCAYFETEGVERMAGGIGAVLRRALDAIGPYWQPRPALRRARGRQRGSGGPRDCGRRRGGGALSRAAPAASPSTRPGKARGARRARHQAAGPALPAAQRSRS